MAGGAGEGGMLTNRTPVQPTRGRAARAPLSTLSSGDSNIHKGTPKTTPHKSSKSNTERLDSGQSVVSTNKKSRSKSRSRKSRTRSKSKSRSKFNIYTPLVDSGTTSKAESAESSDASIPIAYLGKNQQPLILNFGYKFNIVGKTRSLPFRIEAPFSPNDQGAVVPVEFDSIPIEQGVGVTLGQDSVEHGSTIYLKQEESKVLHVLWTPTHEGEMREEIYLKSPWGRLQISLLGIARGSSRMAPPLDKSNPFYGRDNITYDAQQWEDKQCATFMAWLNNLFHPENAVNPISKDQIDAEWKAANALFDSPEMRTIRCAIEKEVKEGRLAMTPGSERYIIDEVRVQEQLTELLLSYTPRWLQLGLRVVLAMDDDQSIKRHNRITKESLKKLIKERVLSEPTAVMTYTGGRCKTPSGKFESKMRASKYQHALSQIMTLVYFLDKAKTTLQLKWGCLFEKSSSMKSSEEVLVSLVQDCFSKQRSTIKHLDYEGISVSHVQNPLDEYDFYVKNLAVDLKDGVCLAKMIDIVTNRSALLSAMQLPTVLRQRKTYNVNLVLSYLRQLGVPNISDITTAHIVDAHQPRVIQLLWSAILHFELPEFRLRIIKHKASVIIQGHARKFLGMRSYQLARDGTILFQSLYRGFAVRTNIDRMISASTLLQKVWRGCNAKLKYGLDLICIITVQSVSRRFLAQGRVMRMARTMNKASADIQRIWRGYHARFNYGCNLLDIIIVQSVCRRFIARNQVKKMAKSMNSASTEIQRIWRGYQAKISVGYDLLDIIAVQSICRRFIARKRVEQLSKAMDNASIDIQRMWRGYNAKLQFGFDLLDIITVQSICRRFIARNAIARHNVCTTKIQSTVRMWAAKRWYHNSRKATCKIQGQIRRVISSRHARHLKSHIVNLQRVCRGWLCRKQIIAPLKMAKLANLVHDEETAEGKCDEIVDKARDVPDCIEPVSIDNNAQKIVSLPISSHPSLLCTSIQEVPLLQEADKEISFFTKQAKRTVVGSSTMAKVGDNVISGHSSPRLPESRLRYSMSRKSPLAEEDIRAIKEEKIIRPSKIVPLSNRARETGGASLFAVRDVPETHSPRLSGPSVGCSSHKSSESQGNVGNIVRRSKIFRPSNRVEEGLHSSSRLHKSLGSSLSDDASLSEANHAGFERPSIETNGVGGDNLNVLPEARSSPRPHTPSLSCSPSKDAFVLPKKGGVTSFYTSVEQPGDKVTGAGGADIITVRKEPKANSSSGLDNLSLGYNSSGETCVSTSCAHGKIIGPSNEARELADLLNGRNTPGSTSSSKPHNPDLGHSSSDENLESQESNSEEVFFSIKHARGRIAKEVGVVTIKMPQTNSPPCLRSASLSHSSTQEDAVLQIDSKHITFRNSPSFRRLGFGSPREISNTANGSVSEGRDAQVFNGNKTSPSECNSSCIHPESFPSSPPETSMAWLTELDSLTCNVEEVASIQIQKVWRHFIASKQFILEKKAAVACQASWRGFAARKIVVKLRNQVMQEAAASKISSAFRSHAAQRKFKLALASVVDIQRYYRGHSAKEMVIRKISCIIKTEKEQSATIVQSYFRRHCSLSRYTVLKAGVLSFQAQARGWLARTAARKHMIRRTDAAEAIQKFYRGFVSRDLLQVTKFAAIIIQSCWRRHLAELLYCLMRKSAVRIQALCRGEQVRQEIAVICEHIRVIQRAGRMYLAKCEMHQLILSSASLLQHREQHAAVQLQKMWRGYKANVDFILLILATIKIQSFIRSHISASHYRRLRKGVIYAQASFRARKIREDIVAFIKMHNASTEIQRIWRGYCAKVNYEYDIIDIITAQAACRRFLAKQKKERITTAVSMIQRAARVAINHMHTSVECFAATEIQRLFRGYRANVDFMLAVLSAITIQTLARGRIARHNVARQREAILFHFAATEIQRVWRGHRTIEGLAQMVTSVIRIQSAVRGWQVRQDIASQHESACILQSVGRGFLAKLEKRRTIAAVTTLQRAAKVMLERVHNDHQFFAAMEIQRHWRGYKTNLEFMLMVVSAIKIQTFTRSILSQCRNKIVKENSAEEGRPGREQLSQLKPQKETDMHFKPAFVAENCQHGSSRQIRFQHFVKSKDEPTGLLVQESKECARATELSNQSKSVTEDASGHALSKFRLVKSLGVATQSLSDDGGVPTALPITSHYPDVKQPSKFERHTIKAIKTILKSNELNKVLKAVMNLQKITQESIEDCELIVKSGAQEKMLSFIQSCNRSSPHLELIRAILAVLANLTRHPPLLLKLANETAIDILTDSVQMFRDKPDIFAQSASLLKKMLRSSNRLMSLYSSPENTNRLNGVLFLCKMKSYELDDMMSEGISSLETVIHNIVNAGCT